MLWRLLSRLSRGGAARLPGAEVPPPARPPQAPPPPRFHSWQQEAAAGSSNSRDEHRQHEHGCWSVLHHCTSLGAFTWGVLAVLALELAKQVHWLNTAQPNGRHARLCPLEGRLPVLPLHPHPAPPAPVPAPFSGGKKPHFFVGADSGQALEHDCPGKSSPSEEYLDLPETGDVPSNTSPEPPSVSLSSQGSVEQTSFHEAASQVQEAFQASISLAFNILGLEHLQSGQDALAFSFFKLAADQNYSKAQFNVGLCYEHGRGTEKDVAKAVLYYKRAARQGHTMAQYRYAKWLLRSWPKVDEDSSVQEAVELLGQAAAAGLTQAQACLGMLCLKGLETGRKTALKYMPAAARSEDPLGICCGTGSGPPQNSWAAGKHNQQAEVADAKPAPQERMPGMVPQETAGMQSQHQLPVALRAVFSSPSLQSLSQVPSSQAQHPVLDLIHSRSAGNLRDVACLPHPTFHNSFSLSLQPFACSSGIAIG